MCLEELLNKNILEDDKIEIADELSDMILFHTRVYENGKKVEKPWENN